MNTGSPFSVYIGLQFPCIASVTCVFVFRSNLLRRRPGLHLPFNATLCTLCFGLALPFTIALFPQTAAVCLAFHLDLQEASVCALVPINSVVVITVCPYHLGTIISSWRGCHHYDKWCERLCFRFHALNWKKKYKRKPAKKRFTTTKVYSFLYWS